MLEFEMLDVFRVMTNWKYVPLRWLDARPEPRPLQRRLKPFLPRRDASTLCGPSSSAAASSWSLDHVISDAIMCLNL
jgi:hypothetical protein